ncbi:MAG: hypothetical protein K6T71_06245, partial [Candidatus Bipolaricaulota bacterium]|nr:hypothetical protein [Candidatus Bipolaricaulota bacterium]
RAVFVIALLSLVLCASWGSVGQARLIGLGGGAVIDWTGASGLGFWPLVRLSVGLFFIGADLDLWLSLASIQAVPSVAIRLPVFASLELYGAVAPASFQLSPVTQTIPRTMIRLGANLGGGLISVFGELGLFAQWEMPITWQGPLVGLGVQLGF